MARHARAWPRADGLRIAGPLSFRRAPTRTTEVPLDDIARTTLSSWESFYVIVGSSGAALTGLQFVVMTLLADSPMRRSTNAIDAFGTPTIVHFCTVLLLSGIMSAPWHALSTVAVMIGAMGLAGLAYCAVVFRRARRQDGYQPVLEDWLFHTVFPCICYATMIGSAIALFDGHDDAFFPIGAVAVALLFIGIHNAWDTVVFIALQQPDDSPKDTPG